MYTIQNILVTTDFSEYSASALEYAQALSVKMKARIHLLHVIPELQFGGGHEENPSAAFQTVPAGVVSVREAAAEEEMRKFVSDHVDEYTFVDHAIRIGQPAREILRYAQEHEIDLIVLATHGRTGLAHILIGSVAEKIVRHSGVPVMTVKPIEMIEPLITNDDVADELHLSDESPDSSTRQ